MKTMGFGHSNGSEFQAGDPLAGLQGVYPPMGIHQAFLRGGFHRNWWPMRAESGIRLEKINEQLQHGSQIG